MTRKTLLFMVLLAAAGIAASQWQDIIRYLEIKQMSAEAATRRTCRPVARKPIRSPEQAGDGAVPWFPQAVAQVQARQQIT